MATEENLKPLKILVFSMGLVLIGGTVLLAGIVMKKIFSEPSAPATYVRAGDCPGGHVDLKGHGEIVGSSMENNVLRAVFKKHTGSEVVMVDMCSGKILGTLQIETDEAGAAR